MTQAVTLATETPQPSPSRGEYLRTFWGHEFYPADPHPADFDIKDIAHALSMITRFNGHLPVHYSVAQHSVIVSRLVPQNLALEGLLHDGAEAYLGDMVRAVKQCCPDFRALEVRVEEAMAKTFGLVFPWPQEVKDADNLALGTEGRDVLARTSDWWKKFGAMEARIIPWPQEVAETIFLARFTELRRL